MAEQSIDLSLINLEGTDSFIFRRFPTQIETSSRVNWQAQNTTTGVQPLFYSNREPRKLIFNELLLDATASLESLTPTLDLLSGLMKETDKGRPPALLAQWGDRSERVVLEELRIVENFFHENGNPLRAIVSLTLTEIQEFEAATTAPAPATLESERGGSTRGPQP